MSVQIHADATNFEHQFNDVDEYVAFRRDEGGLEDGDTFELVRMDVVSKTKYQMQDGQPIPIEIAFPDASGVPNGVGE